MALKEKRIQINGDTFICRELTLRQMLPLISAADKSDASSTMLRLSVHDESGNPVGDRVLDMGYTSAMAIMQAVNEANNLGGSDEGNVPEG